MAFIFGGRRHRGTVHTFKTSAAETASATHATAASRLGGSVIVDVNVTAASGTSPTLIVVVEGSLDGSTWFELGRVGGSGYRAGTSGTAPTGFSAVGQVVAALTGPSLVRTRSIVGGTAPSFTYSVTGFVG